MMLQIAVGLMPRTLSSLQKQPAQGLLPVVTSDEVTYPISLSSIVIEVPAPSAHAGSYPLSLADLALGPVCLVRPVIRNDSGRLTVEPGLWAHDVAQGTATITRQWMIGDTVVPGESGLTFTPTATATPQTIVLAEAASQGSIQTSGLSEPFLLPALTIPPAQPQLINQNNQLVLRNVTTKTAPFQITISEPVVYAGTHTITPSQFVAGPVWLVPPSISRDGNKLSLQRGLPIWLEAMEPVTRGVQWLRGVSVQTAAAIAGAQDQETCQIDPSVDGGMKIHARETITDAQGHEIHSASNEITVASVLTLPAVASLVGIGDSITVGVNATTDKGRWLNIVSAAINSGTLTNAGVSGSVLQNSPDSGGSARGSNGRDRFLAVMTGSKKRELAIIAYGFNDARYTAAPATFNVTAYQNDLHEVVAGLRLAEYPANRILIVAPYWISNTGLTVGSTGFTRQTRAGFEAFVAAARAVADEHGTLYHDAYAWMRDNGAAALIDTDNIHPTDAGHAKIAEGVLYHSAILNSRPSITKVTPSSKIAGRVDVTLTAVNGAASYQVEVASEGSFAFGSRQSVTGTSAAFTDQTGRASLRVRARAVIGGQPGPWTYAASAVTVAESSQPVVADWWYPASIIDVDYANDRARINGVTYNSIAAARTAGVLLTASDVGVDYIDVTGSSSGVLAASGTVLRNSSTSQILANLDNSDDGVDDDERLGIYLTNAHKINLYLRKASVEKMSVVTSETYATGSVAAAAVRLNTSPPSTSYWKTVGSSGSRGAVSMPAYTRLWFGGKIINNKPWLGTLKRVVLVNSSLTDAEVDALVGAIQ